MSKKREKRRSRPPVQLSEARKKKLTLRKNAIIEDFRKVGVTAVSAGLVGLIITGDTITVDEASVILMSGVALWSFAMMMISRGE